MHDILITIIQYTRFKVTSFILNLFPAYAFIIWVKYQRNTLDESNANFVKTWTISFKEKEKKKEEEKTPKSKIGHEITSKEQYYLSFAHNLIVRCITYIPCGGVHSISSCCYKETNCDVQIDFFWSNWRLGILHKLKLMSCQLYK